MSYFGWSETHLKIERRVGNSTFFALFFLANLKETLSISPSISLGGGGHAYTGGTEGLALIEGDVTFTGGLSSLNFDVCWNLDSNPILITNLQFLLFQHRQRSLSV